MKKVTTCLLVLSFFIMSASLTFAQKNFSGRIIDAEDQKPLPGATIRAGDHRGTTSNQQGQFKISGIPSGVQFLQISYVGFETRKIDLETIDNPEDLTITLKKSTFQADEVIVSATRVTDKNAMAYSNVSAQEIGKQNLGQDLPALLNFTPSIITTSDAGNGVGYSGIRIRGTDATRINVTVNGIPYNDAESQGVFWVNMPDFASSVSSIQIQRGVGTSTNGAAAFGATVNVNTNEFRSEPYAEISSSAGSFNTFKNTVKAGTGLLNDRFTVDARLSKITSDGYIDRASSDLQSYYLSGGYFGKKSFARLNIFSGNEQTYQSWDGAPEARVKNDREGMLAFIERNGLSESQADNLLNAGRTYNSYTYDNETDNYKQDHYQLITSHTLHNNLSLNVNGFLVRGKGYYEQFRPDDNLSRYNIAPVVIGDETITRSDVIRRRWLDNYFYGTTFSLDYNSYKKLTANLGGGWNQYDGDHFGQVIWARHSGNSNIRHRYYDNKGFKEDLNFYAKVYYQFTDRLNAFADIQYRGVSHKINGNDNAGLNHQINKKFNFINPKAGLTWKASENSLVYASYSIGNREPNRDDFTEAIAQIQPKSENLQNVEAGVKGNIGNWVFSANYYYMHYKNQLVMTGQLNDVGNAIRMNAPQSYRTGIELETALLLGKKWRWNANATFSSNKIKNFTEYVFDYDLNDYQQFHHGNTNISFSPSVIASSQLSYSPTKNLEITWLAKHVGKQYLDNTSSDDRVLGAYFTNDLRAKWDLNPSWIKGVSLTLLVNNIFNEMYSSNGYTYGYIAGSHIQENFYYPQAGRNFMAGVSIRF